MIKISPRWIDNWDIFFRWAMFNCFFKHTIYSVRFCNNWGNKGQFVSTLKNGFFLCIFKNGFYKTIFQNIIKKIIFVFSKLKN